MRVTCAPQASRILASEALASAPLPLLQLLLARSSLHIKSEAEVTPPSLVHPIPNSGITKLGGWPVYLPVVPVQMSVRPIKRLDGPLGQRPPSPPPQVAVAVARWAGAECRRRGREETGEGCRVGLQGVQYLVR